jgi:UDP-4-amino-4,6-dideoxy-N-acetyl-beta-L-altrosamine transaminase
MIPYGRQDITDADIEAVVSVLKSDFLTQGPAIPRFEEAAINYCGVSHAVAVNSATSALHIACMALGLGRQDWLWTVPTTFVASANCAIYCGAMVDFVDIDPHKFTMSPEALERKLKAAEKTGRLPKIVVPVHLCGQPCDLAAIHALGQRYGFKIIEDASHAVGATYRNEPIGNCRFSDVTVFSFHPVKIITTAEGGMALTNDADLAERMRRARSHGITRNPADMTHPPEGPWYYQQIDIGYNYRITDIQAALGLSQFDRLDHYVAKRNELAARYNSLLEGAPLASQRPNADGYSAFHLYVVRIDHARSRKSKPDLFAALIKDGIGVNLHYIPVHLQPYYAKMGFVRGQFPESEAYYNETMSLPLYPGLTFENQDCVVQALLKHLKT